MSIDIRSFKPVPHSSAAIVISASSQKTLLTNEADAMLYVRVYNGSTAAVFIEFGDVNVVASTTTSLALAPGEVEIFSIGAPSNPAYLAAIGTASSGDLYVSTGVGS